jgi:predicted AAA+ superfamily ATPase
MISHDKIKEIILTWENDISKINIFPREVYSMLKEQFSKQLPLVLHGIRRSGKTYLMYKLFQESTNACYINFEDERLIGLKTQDLEMFYEVYLGVKTPERPVMFMDEVQNVPGWEKFVARLQSKVKFVISGSNASLLSSEYASSLTGRYFPVRIFPLSFKEYNTARGYHDLKTDITEERAILLNLLTEYIDFGGFPQASLEKDGTLIKTTFNSILYRDIIPRFGIQNVMALETLARYLVSNPGKPSSYRSLSTFIGIKHEDTAKNYLSYLEKAYLFESLMRFDYSIKIQMGNLKKIYPADTGLTRHAGHLFSEERGRLLETIVFNELKRRGRDVFYWKNERGKEVDFVVCDGLKPKQLIQVTDIIENERQFKRETDSLLLAAEDLKVKDLLLLTNRSDTFPLPEKIQMQSIISWLL